MRGLFAFQFTWKVETSGLRFWTRIRFRLRRSQSRLPTSLRSEQESSQDRGHSAETREAVFPNPSVGADDCIAAHIDKSAGLWSSTTKKAQTLLPGSGRNATAALEALPLPLNFRREAGSSSDRATTEQIRLSTGAHGVPHVLAAERGPETSKCASP